MKEVDWTKYGDDQNQDGISNRGEHICGDDGAQYAPGTPDDDNSDRVSESLAEKVVANQVDVHEVVDVHAVIPDEPGEPFDYHTHGLEQYGHPEIQVLAPGYCRAAMANLLWNHAERVINAGERFVEGETDAVDGVVCGYQIAPGDSGEDEPRLRIIDVPSACQCSACVAAKSNNPKGDSNGAMEGTEK